MTFKWARKYGLILSIGLIFNQWAGAQVSIHGPDTSVTPSTNNSTFQNFIIAMNSDVADLHTRPGKDLNIEDPIYFHYGMGNPGFTGDWSTSPAGGPFQPVEFRKVKNFHSFHSDNGGSLDIGFIGEESTDANVLGFSTNGEFTELFSWNVGGASAPMSYQIDFSGNTRITLEHRNLSQPVGHATQLNPNRFRIYQGFYNDQPTNEWLFAVADRNSSGDGDFDDGFFYIAGGILPAAPEPEHIALMTIIGLSAWLGLRRRIRRKKS